MCCTPAAPVRAVLNELYDYGRPGSVRLAVLVDRGGRQLPYAADFAAARMALPSSQVAGTGACRRWAFHFANLKKLEPR